MPIAREKNSKPTAKGAAQILGSAAGAFGLSTILQHLSGQALWMPVDWRASVSIFSTLCGMFIYLYTRRCAAAAAHDSSAAQRRLRRARETRVALMLFGAAVVMFIAYMVLRSSCLIFWDPANWFRRERRDASTQPTTQLSEQEVYKNAPEFADPEGRKLYIPLFFPPDLRQEVADVRKNQETEGFGYLLNDDPQHVLNTLAATASTQYLVTSTLFFLNHLLIIALVAAAGAKAGLQYSTAENPSDSTHLGGGPS